LQLPLIVLIPELDPEVPQSLLEQLRHARAVDPQCIGYLALLKTFQVVQNQDLPLALGDAEERGLDGLPHRRQLGTFARLDGASPDPTIDPPGSSPATDSGTR
jgi:hypothetical protein